MMTFMIQPNPQQQDSLVVKSNALIESRFMLSVSEIRIITMMIAQIGREDKDFSAYRIQIKDFIDLTQTKHKGEYERAREITKGLMQKVLEIPTQKGHLQIHFLSSAEYEIGSGFVNLSFDPRLKPYLLELKKNFTTYLKNNVLTLPSSYSFRIYELLKQYETISHRTISVQDLHFLLKTPKSYQKGYGIFKCRVILKAQADLKVHTDISFDFEELKQEGGKKVTHILFKIISQKPNAHQLPESHLAKAIENKEGDPQKIASPVYERLMDIGFNHKQSQKYLSDFSEDYIIENLNYVDDVLKRNQNISNKRAYTAKALKEDFRYKETLEERQKREKRQDDKTRREVLEKAKQEQDKQEELYLKLLEQECQKLLQDPDFELDRVAEHFKKQTLDFFRGEIDRKQLKPSQYMRNLTIKGAFCRYLAEHYLDYYWHSFELWQEKKDSF